MESSANPQSGGEVLGSEPSGPAPMRLDLLFGLAGPDNAVTRALLRLIASDTTANLTAFGSYLPDDLP